MLIVGICTSSDLASCALLDTDSGECSSLEQSGRRHVEMLMPSIEGLLAERKKKFKEVDRVAIDVGPGLFTGLRVGVATAKALCFALKCDLVGVSSLAAIAWQFREKKISHIAIDAKRGDVFVAGAKNGRLLTSIELQTPEQFAYNTATEGALVATNASNLLKKHIGDKVELIDCLPKAKDIAYLGAEEFPVQTEDLEVLFMRDSDAQLNREVSK